LLTDGELFVVDVTLVQKVVGNIEFTPIPAAPPAVAGIANLKGGIITLISLAELLGRKRGEQAVNAVVFKSSEISGDQMGLLVDKPGDLVDIDDDGILPPPLAEKVEERFCISGMAEAEGMLYRIIDVDEIANRFKGGGEPTPDTGTITQGGVNDEGKN
jgi:purine-binding chemotaxis protein CheW